MIRLIEFKGIRFFALATLFFFLSSDFSLRAAVAVPPSSAAGTFRSADFKIPRDLGSIDEIFRGRSGKFFVLIQDAHASIEAQNRISDLIGRLVAERGVRTVYEEGYEGPVPTDRLFGRIRDPQLKRKVSDILLEQMRIGAAEYAHINRTEDFRLIGADDVRYHLEGIEWYKRAKQIEPEVRRDLDRVRAQLMACARVRFSGRFLDWMKSRDRYHADQTDFLTFLRATAALLPADSLFRYPRTSEFLKKIDARDPSASRTEVRDLLDEAARMETDLPEAYLKNRAAKDLFRYLEGIRLFEKLSALSLTPSDFERLKKILPSLKTRDLADFIAAETGKNVVLSGFWEDAVASAVSFYRCADIRDRAAVRRFRDFIRFPDERMAVVVYGGFHRPALTKFFRDRRISYAVVMPRISRRDPKSEESYVRLMSGGIRPVEKDASRPETLFEWEPARADALLARIETGLGGRVMPQPAAAVTGAYSEARAADAPAMDAAVTEILKPSRRVSAFRGLRRQLAGLLPKAVSSGEIYREISRTGSVPVDRVPDRRVRALMRFLKERGLDDFVFIGGVPRNILFAAKSRDADLTVLLDVTEDEAAVMRRDPLAATERIIRESQEKLRRLADALGTEPERLLNPEPGREFRFRGLAVEFLGPAALRKADGSILLHRRLFVSRATGEVFTASVVPNLNRMAVGADGKFYGAAAALADYESREINFSGPERGSVIFRDVLRAFRLKHETGFRFSAAADRRVRLSIEQFRQGSMTGDAGVVRTELERIMAGAREPESVRADLEAFGIPAILAAMKAPAAAPRQNLFIVRSEARTGQRQVRFPGFSRRDFLASTAVAGLLGLGFLLHRTWVSRREIPGEATAATLEEARRILFSKIDSYARHSGKDTGIFRELRFVLPSPDAAARALSLAVLKRRGPEMITEYAFGQGQLYRSWAFDEMISGPVRHRYFDQVRHEKEKEDAATVRAGLVHVVEVKTPDAAARAKAEIDEVLAALPPNSRLAVQYEGSRGHYGIGEYTVDLVAPDTMENALRKLDYFFDWRGEISVESLVSRRSFWTPGATDGRAYVDLASPVMNQRFKIYAGTQGVFPQDLPEPPQDVRLKLKALFRQYPRARFYMTFLKEWPSGTEYTRPDVGVFEVPYDKVLYVTIAEARPLGRSEVRTETVKDFNDHEIGLRVQIGTVLDGIEEVRPGSRTARDIAQKTLIYFIFKDMGLFNLEPRLAAWTENQAALQANEANINGAVHSPRALPYALAALTDPRRPVRHTAALLLQKIRDKRASVFLLDAIRDERDEPVLAELLKAFKDSAPEGILGFFERALRMSGNTPTVAADETAQAIRQGRFDAEGRFRSEVRGEKIAAEPVTLGIPGILKVALIGLRPQGAQRLFDAADEFLPVGRDIFSEFLSVAEFLKSGAAFDAVVAGDDAFKEPQAAVQLAARLRPEIPFGIYGYRAEETARDRVFSVLQPMAIYPPEREEGGFFEAWAPAAMQRALQTNRIAALAVGEGAARVDVQAAVEKIIRPGIAELVFFSPRGNVRAVEGVQEQFFRYQPSTDELEDRQFYKRLRRSALQVREGAVFTLQTQLGWAVYRVTQVAPAGVTFEKIEPPAGSRSEARAAEVNAYAAALHDLENRILREYRFGLSDRNGLFEQFVREMMPQAFSGNRKAVSQKIELMTGSLWRILAYGEAPRDWLMQFLESDFFGRGGLDLEQTVLLETLGKFTWDNARVQLFLEKVSAGQSPVSRNANARESAQEILGEAVLFEQGFAEIPRPPTQAEDLKKIQSKPGLARRQPAVRARSEVRIAGAQAEFTATFTKQQANPLPYGLLMIELQGVTEASRRAFETLLGLKPVLNARYVLIGRQGRPLLLGRIEEAAGVTEGQSLPTESILRFLPLEGFDEAFERALLVSFAQNFGPEKFGFVKLSPPVPVVFLGEKREGFTAVRLKARSEVRGFDQAAEAVVRFFSASPWVSHLPVNPWIAVGTAAAVSAAAAYYLHHRYFRYPSFLARWDRDRDARTDAAKLTLQWVWGPLWVPMMISLLFSVMAFFIPIILAIVALVDAIRETPREAAAFGLGGLHVLANFVTLSAAALLIVYGYFFQKAAKGHRPESVRVWSPAELRGLQPERLFEMAKGLDQYEAGQAEGAQAAGELVRRKAAGTLLRAYGSLANESAQGKIGAALAQMALPVPAISGYRAPPTVPLGEFLEKHPDLATGENLSGVFYPYLGRAGHSYYRRDYADQSAREVFDRAEALLKLGVPFSQIGPVIATEQQWAFIAPILSFLAFLAEKRFIEKTGVAARGLELIKASAGFSAAGLNAVFAESRGYLEAGTMALVALTPLMDSLREPAGRTPESKTGTLVSGFFRLAAKAAGQIDVRHSGFLGKILESAGTESYGEKAGEYPVIGVLDQMEPAFFGRHLAGLVPAAEAGKLQTATAVRMALGLYPAAVSDGEFDRAALLIAKTLAKFFVAYHGNEIEEKVRTGLAEGLESRRISLDDLETAMARLEIAPVFSIYVHLRRAGGLSTGASLPAELQKIQAAYSAVTAQTASGPAASAFVSYGLSGLRTAAEMEQFGAALVSLMNEIASGILRQISVEDFGPYGESWGSHDEDNPEYLSTLERRAAELAGSFSPVRSEVRQQTNALSRFFEDFPYNAAEYVVPVLPVAIIGTAAVMIGAVYLQGKIREKRLRYQDVPSFKALWEEYRKHDAGLHIGLFAYLWIPMVFAVTAIFGFGPWILQSLTYGEAIYWASGILLMIALFSLTVNGLEASNIGSAYRVIRRVLSYQPEEIKLKTASQLAALKPAELETLAEGLNRFEAGMAEGKQAVGELARRKLLAPLLRTLGGLNQGKEPGPALEAIGTFGIQIPKEYAGRKAWKGIAAFIEKNPAAAGREYFEKLYLPFVKKYSYLNADVAEELFSRTQELIRYGFGPFEDRTAVIEMAMSSAAGHKAFLTFLVNALAGNGLGRSVILAEGPKLAKTVRENALPAVLSLARAGTAKGPASAERLAASVRIAEKWQGNSYSEREKELQKNVLEALARGVVNGLWDFPQAEKLSEGTKEINEILVASGLTGAAVTRAGGFQAAAERVKAMLKPYSAWSGPDVIAGLIKLARQGSLSFEEYERFVAAVERVKQETSAVINPTYEEPQTGPYGEDWGTNTVDNPPYVAFVNAVIQDLAEFTPFPESAESAVSATLINLRARPEFESAAAQLLGKFYARSELRRAPVPDVWARPASWGRQAATSAQERDRAARVASVLDIRRIADAANEKASVFIDFSDFVRFSAAQREEIEAMALFHRGRVNVIFYGVRAAGAGEPALLEHWEKLRAQSGNISLLPLGRSAVLKRYYQADKRMIHLSSAASADLDRLVRAAGSYRKLRFFQYSAASETGLFAVALLYPNLDQVFQQNRVVTLAMLDSIFTLKVQEYLNSLVLGRSA